MNNNYMIREFMVMSKEDYNNGNLNYKTFTARLYKDFTVKIEDKTMSNKEFNKLYTTNLL